jgi:hypothetical protein
MELLKVKGSWYFMPEKSASMLQVHSVNCAAKLIHTKRALFSTITSLAGGASFRSA